MTVSAMDIPPAARVLRRSGFTIAADGSYAACLAEAAPAETGRRGRGARRNEAGDLARPSGRWFPERWTLDGPEPYAVPLPGTQPEEAGTQVVPLSDGRVLIRRRVADRHDLALLLPHRARHRRAAARLADRLRGPAAAALAGAPGTGFALVYVRTARRAREPTARSAVWQVHGTGDGAPRLVMTVAGRCTGGVWLDRTGRLLALDRELAGRTKAVAVDLRAAGDQPAAAAHRGQRRPAAAGRAGQRAAAAAQRRHG